MNRLSAYMVRVFARDTLAILGTGLVLLFLIQCLRIFDVVSVKGQNLSTLLGQAFLGMPPLLIVFGYVCMGIGLARGFGALQASHELHIIHSNRRIGALLWAVTVFAALGALAALIFANFVEPGANRRLDNWSASVAADIVGRTLTPHRFTEVVPGVVIVIGARQGIGHISNFFADDRRDPQMTRTYVAKAGVVAESDEGYVLKLQDGSVQYFSADKQYSAISFKNYTIRLSDLTEPLQNRSRLSAQNSLELVNQANQTGHWSTALVRELTGRLAEGLKVLAMCVFVTAAAAFPHARRKRRGIPLEISVLLVAFVQGAISNYASGPPVLALTAGPLLVLIVSGAALLYRLRVFAPRPKATRAA